MSLTPDELVLLLQTIAPTVLNIHTYAFNEARIQCLTGRDGKHVFGSAEQAARGFNARATVASAQQQ